MGELHRRIPKRVKRKLTASERAEIDAALRLVEREKPEILELARQVRRERDAALRPLREAIALLRTEREAQGLSLADVQGETGICRSALCRLETDLEANPTVATLLRYADALDKRLLITLADR